jgi:2-keto-3-deoxy-L-rhamnonate aldolase RhmA
MNVPWYKTKNTVRKIFTRLRYPPPLYKRVGAVSAVVNRKNGRKEVLNNISVSYAKRWGVRGGQ